MSLVRNHTLYLARLLSPRAAAAARVHSLSLPSNSTIWVLDTLLLFGLQILGYIRLCIVALRLAFFFCGVKASLYPYIYLSIIQKHYTLSEGCSFINLSYNLPSFLRSLWYFLCFCYPPVSPSSFSLNNSRSWD